METRNALQLVIWIKICWLKNHSVLKILSLWRTKKHVCLIWISTSQDNGPSMFETPDPQPEMISNQTSPNLHNQDEKGKWKKNTITNSFFSQTKTWKIMPKKKIKKIKHLRPMKRLKQIHYPQKKHLNVLTPQALNQLKKVKETKYSNFLFFYLQNHFERT